MIFKPPPGLEDVLDGPVAVTKTTLEPPLGLEDNLDVSRGVAESTLKPPPGLEEALTHTSEGVSCHSAGSFRPEAEAVDDQKIVTRCTLLAHRTPCRIHVTSESPEPTLITLMRREQLSQKQHVSSTRGGCADAGDPSVGALLQPRSSRCELFRQGDKSEPGPVSELADDLEGAMLPCYKQQIAHMDVPFLKGTSAAGIVSRGYIFPIFLAILLIVLGGGIAFAFHSCPE